jgi:alpha-L-fucosidase 2
LIENVPEEFREDSAGIGVGATLDLRSPVNPFGSGMDKTVGDLPWALHNYWLQYMFSMDERRLVRNFFPLLRRSINLYFHLLESDEDGTLHLKETTSPEYGNAPDCNFDLALFRWGCGVLIDICKRHNIDDPLLPEWENVLEKLTDFPVDENGFMIGRAVPYDRGHRHPSHLLMIYPLYLVNIEQPGRRELIEKSLKHWLALGESYGFTFTGAASIAASIGDGNAALEYLNRMIRYPNTLYRESDGKGGPVIETPLSAAKSLQDMLIQSWNGKIRIFPAIPDEWKDVCMANMRTEGAFLISASRENGITRFVHVKSLAGSPCRLIPEITKDGSEDRVSVFRDGQITVRELADGILELDLKKGEEATIFVGETFPDIDISPVEQSSMQ